MSARTTKKAATIRAGTGGWEFKPWRGSFYPEGLIQRRELEYASRQLTTIEINGTYYGAQKPATYAKWAEQTPEGFVFSVKAPRYTASRTILATAGDSIDNFVGDLAAFGDRLGPVLWQLDDHHGYDGDDVAAFLDLLPGQLDGRPLRHVLEVRNPSFQCAEYVELMRQHKRPTVFTDSPDHPSFADITGDFVYLRLMQSRAAIATGYSADALALWAERARCWRDGKEPADVLRVSAVAARSTPRDVFVYFINGAKERAPHAAMALLAELEKK